MIYDVIILGGGIAGLYTAYKLNRRSPHLKILLLEKENYLGGRVFTVHQGNMNVEAGAGRFADNHRYLMELLKELKLTSKMVKNGSEVAYAPANGTGVGSGMGSSEAMNPTTNVIGDRRSPEAFDKHFEVALMDIESEIMQIPETEYQAEFSIGSTVFANIINQLKLFGDSLDIKCNEEKIELCSNSMEQGKMSVEIQMDDLTSFVIDEGGELQLSFSLTFMHNICLYNKISKEMEVKIGADYPMKIVYQLPGHDDAKMVFFLAPKISE